VKLRERFNNLFATPKIAQLTTDTTCLVPTGYRGSPHDAANENPSRSVLCFPLSPKREFNPWDRKKILEKVRAPRSEPRPPPANEIARSASTPSAPVSSHSPNQRRSGTRPPPALHGLGKQPRRLRRRRRHDFLGTPALPRRDFFSEAESFDALVSSPSPAHRSSSLFDKRDRRRLRFPARPASPMASAPTRRTAPSSTRHSPVDSSGKPATRTISAVDMIHLFRRKRPGQLRAISPFRAAHQLRDRRHGPRRRDHAKRETAQRARHQGHEERRRSRQAKASAAGSRKS
jgi:hypothetical protein